MSEATYEGNSVEAALEKAASALGVAVTDLEHEVVEKKQDFWGTGDETFVIKAWQRAPAEEVAEEPAEGADTEGVDVAPVEEVEQVEAAEPEADAASVEAAEPEAVVPSAEAEPETGTGGPVEQAAEAHERDAEADERAEERGRGRDDRPGREAADVPPEGSVDSEEIKALLAQIFHDMEFECTVEIEEEDEGFLATIAGDDKDELLEGNGRCLSALELLVNNAFRNRMARDQKIRVDAGDFRSRRDQELADVAYQVAHSAKQTGRTQETQPLNPYERRLVHLALAEDPAVSTRSRGSGFLKNVQVIPQEGGGRGRRR